MLHMILQLVGFAIVVYLIGKLLETIDDKDWPNSLIYLMMITVFVISASGVL